MGIRDIDYATAKAFVVRWHYSGCMPHGSNICFGMFDENDCLYAVAVYGNGINPHQASYLSRILDTPISKDEYLELTRLCRIEPRRDDLPLTMLLSHCHKTLVSKGTKIIISFSDPEHSHHGGIYRAANFREAGKTVPVQHVVGADGIPRHRRFAYRYARRKGISIAQAREVLGLKIVTTTPKTRWLIGLGKTRKIVASKFPITK